MLDLNTTLGEYVKQIINEILPSIIISQYLDLKPRGILDVGMVFEIPITIYFKRCFDFGSDNGRGSHSQGLATQSDLCSIWDHL